MQKESLTPTTKFFKVPPSTLDQAWRWLEKMQHRLNLCIKPRQNVPPRTLVAFVTVAECRHPITWHNRQHVGQSIQQAPTTRL